MSTLQNVVSQWRDVHRDITALMTRIQYMKFLAFKATRNSRYSSLVPEPGRVTLAFDAARHDGLNARLSAVRASLDMFCRDLDQKNTYKHYASEIDSLRVKIKHTQQLLDQWYCDNR
jgi:hypothetical protein